MPEPVQETSEDTKQKLAEARDLLHSLRGELERHPKLEEAIVKVELALENLTLKTGGML